MGSSFKAYVFVRIYDKAEVFYFKSMVSINRSCMSRGHYLPSCALSEPSTSLQGPGFGWLCSSVSTGNMGKFHKDSFRK